MKRNGFTLIELLGVIVILAVIALIIFPSVTGLIKESQDELYLQQINQIIVAAKKWGVNNSQLLKENQSIYLEPSQLLNKKYIDTDVLIDPRNKEKTINGCIIITYDKTYSSYEYEFSEQVCHEIK